MASSSTMWVNRKTKQVMVSVMRGRPNDRDWHDPIGAAYAARGKVTDKKLMHHVAIVLGMQGFNAKDVAAALRLVEGQNPDCG